MSIELVMPSNHLIFCHPLLLPPSIFPASGSFQMSQLFASGGRRIGVSASTSVLPVNTQDWSPLGWTSWISLQSKGLSSLLQQHTSKASTILCSAFFIVQLLHLYLTTGKTIALTRWTFVGKVMSLFFILLLLLLFCRFLKLNLFYLEGNCFTILWWFLPYIDMNLPRVHMCSPTNKNKWKKKKKKKAEHWKMSLLFNMLSRLIISFLPKSKHLLISWL